MCFRIDNTYPDCLMAHKDIVCYKVFIDKDIKEDFFFSEFFKHLYVLNKEQRRALKIDGGDCLEVLNNRFIDKGFHSFSSIKKAINYASVMEKSYGQKCYVVKCEIPKGSAYYYSKMHSEYVSSGIVLRHKYSYISVQMFKHLYMNTIY